MIKFEQKLKMLTSNSCEKGWIVSENLIEKNVTLLVFHVKIKLYINTSVAIDLLRTFPGEVCLDF